MGKAKQILVLVLAVVLLIAGGMLPFLTAAIQDQRQNEAVQYGDMSTLELVLRGEEQEPLDMFTKLLLLQTGETVELAENEVNATTHEELLALADRALADYYNAGLLLWEPGEMELKGYIPLFLYLPGKPEVNAQMWMLKLIDPEGDQLTIVADQETGNLIAMEYYSSSLMEKLGYDMEAYGALMAEVYFSTLGLEPFAIEGPYYDAAISQLYYLEQEGYENVLIHLSIQLDGFYITTGPVDATVMQEIE